jgi:elongation factor Ts
MSVSASIIKELRDKTGAGMSDCKKALEENNSNIEEAITWLRKKGLASASKKAGRETSEGAIAAFVSGNKATIIELSSETDFVGKNEKFLGLAEAIVKSAHAFEGKSVPEFLDYSADNSSTANELIAEHISIIGENIVLKRLDHLGVNHGKVLAYFHNKLADNMGKIGVLVALEGEVNSEIEEFGKQLAMHIAASKPAALNIDSLDPLFIEKEKGILRSQASESGKSADVVEKMIEGRIRKFLEEVVLLEQPFVMDGKTKIKKVIEDLESKNNCKFTVSGYIRYEIGES